MILRQNTSLKTMNTFGMDVSCPYFADIRKVSDLDQIKEFPAFADINWEILGGGSNILYTSDRVKPVVKISIPGIRVFSGPGSDVLVKVGAGVVWHDLVLWCLENKIYGLENLSLIPGQVGAAPIQNIGAYGVELKDSFETLEAYAITTGNKVTMDAYDCGFGYRNSVFKSYEKGKYVITSLTLRLSRSPQLQLDYGDIRAALAELGIKNPTPLDVSRAVVSIRNTKLPDPAVIGNAGSFFKNPEVGQSVYDKLKTDFSDLPGYPGSSKDKVKIPAGWLIERLGWKGYRDQDAGVHERQALVLVNYGSATGTQIVDLSQRIQKSVEEKFGIKLDPEVNIL
jgi:UDP-N-acetylmuramate dehydrogenase